MNDRPPRTPSNIADSTPRRSLVERVRGILATKNLTMYGIAALSRRRHPSESSYHLPHNFYFQLESVGWSPTLHQLAALAELSNYRLADWLEVFGFRWDDVARVQAALPRPRTALLDGTVHEVHRQVPWFHDRLRPDPMPAATPLSHLLESSGKLPVSLLPFPTESSRFRYAKIGQQDAFAFPGLVPGSIVRADPRLAARHLRLAKRKDTKHIFLVEYEGGFCCCRLHFGTRNRITLLPTQLPFANVEFALGAEARILGLVDLEFRPLIHPRTSVRPNCLVPEVAATLARLWTPRPLAESTTSERPGRLLRDTRLRAAMSLRVASAMSRDIANAFNDDRYFISQGSLSDYEADDRPPRHIHKLFSLSILYAIPLSELLRSYGVDLKIKANPIPTEWMADRERSESSELEKPPAHRFLSDNLKRLGQLPFFAYDSVASLSGLPDISLHDIFWMDGNAKPMHPVLAGAFLAVINRRKTTPPAFLRKSLWEQPLYLVLRRDGSYLLSSCTLEDHTIVAHPYADGFIPHERLRNRVDAEVLGQIVALVRSLLPTF